MARRLRQLGRGARCTQLAARARRRRPAPPSRSAAPRRSLADLDLQLAAVELDRDRAGRAAQEGGDRGAAGARAGGERLPHPALEDPRPHPAAVDAQKETLVRFGNSSLALDLRADRRQVELLELVADLDRALRVADRDVLELPLAAAELSVPRAVLGPAGEVLGGRRRPGPSRPAGPLGPVIVGVIGPATVRIANSSASVQPWRRR